MFLPPEHRQPRPPPWEPPPKRRISAREESVVLWVMGFVLVLLVLAPIGGSTVLEAFAYLFRR